MKVATAVLLEVAHPAHPARQAGRAWAQSSKARVPLPAAGQLRRRRWLNSSVVVAVAIVAAGMAYVATSSALAKAPLARVVARVASSAAVTARAWMYFRPVDCVIAPLSAGPTNAAPAGGPASSAKQACNLGARQQVHYAPPHSNAQGDTLAAYDRANSTVVLAYYAGREYGRYLLGPAEMSGSIVNTATAVLDAPFNQWGVDLTFTAKGTTQFNRYAAQHYSCYLRDPSDPPQCALQAVEVEGTVEGDPAIEASSFPGGIEINGSMDQPFTKAQASTLASLVRSASTMSAVSG